MTSTSTTTTSRGSPSGDKIFKLKLNGREIIEKDIFSSYQKALAAVARGDEYKLIELERLANGNIRGYIESLDGRRWRRDVTDLIKLEYGRGTIWRLTPHPSIENTFQLHYDENYWYDIDQYIRLAIHASPFIELGAAILEVTRITFYESILMEDVQFLWTLE